MPRGDFPGATSLVDVIQLDFKVLLAADSRADGPAMNAAGHRLELFAHVGHFPEIEVLAARFKDASGGPEGTRQHALSELASAIANLPPPSLDEAAARGAVSAARVAYVEFLMAQQARDRSAVTEWLSLLRDAAAPGNLAALKASVDALTDAFKRGNQPEIQDAVESVYTAVMSLE